MSTPINIIRAYDAKIDDVRSEDMSLVCRVNTSDVDYYETVLSARGIRFNNYESLGKPVLWEHAKDPRRFTDPIGNAMWIKNNGGSNPTEIIAKPRFLHDDFSRQRWEWFRDGIIKGWSVNILPDVDTMGPPTSEEIRSRPDWERAKTIFRGGTLVEFSGTVLPGNPRALTDSRAAAVLDLVQRNLLWLPDEAEPVYREAASRTSVSMPGLPALSDESDPALADTAEPDPEFRTMTDSTGGLAGGGAAVKTSPGLPSPQPKAAPDEDEDDEDGEEEEGEKRGAPEADGADGSATASDPEPEPDDPATERRDIPEDATIARRIVKKNGKFYVFSEDGSKRLGGPYSSRQQAEHRLQQVEYFKHEGAAKGERAAPAPPRPAARVAPAPDPDPDPIQHDGHGGWTARGFPGITFPTRELAGRAMAAAAEPGRSLSQALADHDEALRRRNREIAAGLESELERRRSLFELREFGIV